MTDECKFKAKVKASVVVDMDIEINANESFDDARKLAESAVDQWFGKLFREYAPQNWPNPEARSTTVEVLSVSGTWERMNSDDSK